VLYTAWQLEEMKSSHALAMVSTKETTDHESPNKDDSWRLHYITGVSNLVFNFSVAFLSLSGYMLMLVCSLFLASNL